MSQKESGKRPQQKMAPPSFPPPSCPRCLSDNTKFCYYNNYTVSQPRYYCKDCRRYWTHGGALRNIPTGGGSRKRGRIDSSSSTSQVLIPPPSTTWGLGAISDNIGRGTIYKPPVTETMISFINGGGRLNQTVPFGFSLRGASSGGGVNMNGFDSVGVGFSGGARLNPGFRDFGSFPVVQGPQHHPPPQSVWTAGRNMALNNTSTTARLSNPNNFMSIARDPVDAAANVASINEWSELNDIGYDEDDPLRSYKPPSP